MNYSKMATKEEIAKKLTKINPKKGIEKSGIPIMYENEDLYIEDKTDNSLIIGSTGSGKTQAIILPTLKLAMKAKESCLVVDPKGELYTITANNFKKEGYNTIVLDFDQAKYGNNWNPMTFPYKLYKEGNKDKAMELLEDLGYYLFTEINELKTSDPFWTNTAIDYFTGLVLYLFENGKPEDINIKSVCDLSISLNEKEKIEELMKNIDKKSAIYYNLSGTLNAPQDTRESILSVFNQKTKKYVAREKLSNMLSKNDFDITEISNEPTIIFAISGYSSNNNLILLLASQIITGVDLYGHKEKNMNLLLDEFDALLPIKNFNKLMMYVRSIKIRLIALIQNFSNLNNTYGNEQTDVLTCCFSNIIYLYSNDIYTLEYISKLCGSKEENGKIVPLVTPEELKTLQLLESIVLMMRTMPFKTQLLPDYKIDWNMNTEDATLPLRK